MISNSYTFNDHINDSNKLEHYFNVTGCTEYPALGWRTKRHVMLPFYIFDQSDEFKRNIDANLIKLFGKEYTRKQYMMDYINMIYEMFVPINTRAGESLFERYTFKDYKDDLINRPLRRNDGYRPLRVSETGFDPQQIGQNGGSTYIPVLAFNDDDVIGIVTNCHAIRKIMKARYADNDGNEEKCRKVQLAHTTLRLIYSNGYQIPLIALKLYKEYNVDTFYALWIAYHLTENSSSNYGDIFSTNNNGFVSYATFVDRFFDKKLNSSVMAHFSKEDHPLAEYLTSNINEKLCLNSAMSTYLLGSKCEGQGAINRLAKDDIGDKVRSLISEGIDSVSGALLIMKFTFTKKLFNSVVLNVSYDGIEVPNSKLGRIIFKDENETALSVLKTSKFIQIK